MTVRLFACRHCGHMLRLGAMRCGRCDLPTPVRNWTSTHIVGFTALAVLAVAGVAMLPTIL